MNHAPVQIADVSRADTSPPRRNCAYATLALVLSVVGICFVAYRAWVTDDAFITFRHLANLRDGFGPVFNPGYRVQGFTHPLWFLLLAASSFVVDLYAAAVGWGFLLTGGFVLSLAWFLRGHAGRHLALLAGFLVLFASRTFVEFQTSGLETCLSAMLVVVLFGWTASRDLQEQPAPVAGISWLCALLVLNRPDYVVLCSPVLVGVCAHLLIEWRTHGSTRGWGKLINAVFLPGVPLLAWYGFAAVYYGTPLPNTAYAKTGLPLGEALACTGWYVRRYVSEEPFQSAVMIAAIGWALAAGWRQFMAEHRHGGWVMCLALGLIAHLLYLSAIGCDYMRGRMFLPVLIGSVVLATQLIAVRLRSAEPPRWVLVALPAGLLLAAALRGKWPASGFALAQWVGQRVLGSCGPGQGLIGGVAMLLLVVAGIVTIVCMGRLARTAAPAAVLSAIVAVLVVAGTAFHHTDGFSQGLVAAAAGFAIVVAAWTRRPGRMQMAVLVAGVVLPASVGSLSDFDPRAHHWPTPVVHGIADEWTWYAGERFNNPFVGNAAPYGPNRALGSACRTYAKTFGEFAVARGAIGVFSYYAGPEVHVVDVHGLTDPFIARRPESAKSRVGHGDFDIPPDYLQTMGVVSLLPDWQQRIVSKDESLLREARMLQAHAVWGDPQASRQYHEIRKVTCGPLFSAERFRAIPAFILRPRHEERAQH